MSSGLHQCADSPSNLMGPLSTLPPKPALSQKGGAQWASQWQFLLLLHTCNYFIPREKYMALDGEETAHLFNKATFCILTTILLLLLLQLLTNFSFSKMVVNKDTDTLCTLGWFLFFFFNLGDDHVKFQPWWKAEVRGKCCLTNGLTEQQAVNRGLSMCFQRNMNDKTKYTEKKNNKKEEKH